jgi:signal transduction histidine kinase
MKILYMAGKTLKSTLSQNRSRFLFIIFSLIIFSPMPLASLFLQSGNGGRPEHNSGFILVIIFAYIVLEFIEYIKYNYAAGKKILLVFFTIRFLLWLSPLVLYRFEASLFINMILTPVIAFYAYFCFIRIISISLCSLIVLYEFIIGIFAGLKHNDLSNSITLMILFIVVKLVFILYFQMYARLWERDKKILTANEKLMTDLQISHRQLKNYAEQVAGIVASEERNKIAREIHDSLGHNLAAISIQLSKAKAFYDRDKGQSLKALEDARQAASEAIEDVRESVQAISSRKQISFKESVDKIIDRIDKNAYKVDYKVLGNYDGFNYSVLIALYRVIQEGITNIFKHSEADNIWLTINFNINNAVLTIRDNGKGFDLKTLKTGGFGLNSLKERIELVQGNIKINTGEGKGTELIVTVPKDPVKIFTGS